MSKTNQPLLSVSSSTNFRKPQTTVSELVSFDIPGRSRILTKEEIAAEYGNRATRPIPEAFRRNKRTAIAIRIAKEVRLPFAVFKVYDSGHRTFVSQHETYEIAEREAGKKRDAMTDDECGKDFTFLPGERRRGYAKRQ